MTLSPLYNRRVRGVAAERYPLNAVCAHPECSEPAVDPHHCFRRSAIGNASWFVEIDQGIDAEVRDEPTFIIIPHVTGLCRSHHNEVTDDRAWIRLEGGEFSWWDAVDDCTDPNGEKSHGWRLAGALDPQPGERKKSKKPRKKYQGEKKRNKEVFSCKVPKDEREDGLELLRQAIEDASFRINREGEPDYYVLMDVLNWFNLNFVKEAE